jgi:hypothetical protein
VEPNGRSEYFWQTWTAPKYGLAAGQNEDACEVRPFAAAGGEGLLIAVADGASESVYAGPWARALVAGAEPDWPGLDDAALGARLDTVRRAFAPAPPGQPIPWYVRNKYVAQGSQAALLVATVTATGGDDGHTVRAVAVGDVCLILLRPAGEVQSFPVQASDEFGTQPDLVHSRPQTALGFAHWEGRLLPGEALLACTDALAKWALECIELRLGDVLLGALFRILATAPVPDRPDDSPPSNTTPFEGLLQRHRSGESRPRMRDDDCTLVFCMPTPTARTEAGPRDDRTGQAPEHFCRDLSDFSVYDGSSIGPDAAATGSGEAKGEDT